jgi:hypothetical protein
MVFVVCDMRRGVPQGPPGSVSDVTRLRATRTSITVEWNAAVGAKAYNVEFAVHGAPTRRVLSAFAAAVCCHRT